MLSSKFRLNRSDFSKIKENIKQTKRVNFGNFLIFKKDFKKWGIIISKKTIKKAHDRNKYKRIYFNFIKDNFNNLPPSNLLYLQKVTTLCNFKKDLKEEMNKIMLEYNNK